MQGAGGRVQVEVAGCRVRWQGAGNAGGRVQGEVERWQGL